MPTTNMRHIDSVGRHREVNTNTWQTTRTRTARSKNKNIKNNNLANQSINGNVPPATSCDLSYFTVCQAEHFEFAKSNLDVSESTIKLFLTVVPGILAFLRPIVKLAVCSAIDEPLLKALGLPRVCTFVVDDQSVNFIVFICVLP